MNKKGADSKASKKDSDKKFLPSFLNKDISLKSINFKNLNYGKIIKIAIIVILIIALIVSFYEYRKKADDNTQISGDGNKSNKINNSNYLNTNNSNNNQGDGGDGSDGNGNSGECADSDNGREIWVKGTCNDSHLVDDFCLQNFEGNLREYSCVDDYCTSEVINCRNYSAICYEGRCIETNKDSDNDGFTDLDEYEVGTDPNDPASQPFDHQIINSSKWYCCKQNSNYDCFQGTSNLYCPSGWDVQPRGPYNDELSCSAECSAPTPIQYDCNYTWPQQILNKETNSIVYICSYGTPYIPYCKAGTPQCCNYDSVRKFHFDCVNMNPAWENKTDACIMYCKTLGFYRDDGKSGQCDGSIESPEYEVYYPDKNCCCGGPFSSRSLGDCKIELSLEGDQNYNQRRPKNATPGDFPNSFAHYANYQPDTEGVVTTTVLNSSIKASTTYNHGASRPWSVCIDSYIAQWGINGPTVYIKGYNANNQLIVELQAFALT